MTEKESAGARWFREQNERRAQEAADKARTTRQKGLDALARARVARERAVQDGFDGPGSRVDEERTLMERILAEPEQRSRERLEAELQALRARMKREGERRR
jgi:hypothetical protein